MNWGDVPTWLAALFAAAAGVIALLLYLREAERDERAVEQQRRRDEEALSWQASKIAGWYMRKVTSNSVTGQVISETWGVTVTNGSDVPAYDLHVDFYLIPPTANGGEIGSAVGQVRKRVLPKGDNFYPAPEEMLRQVEDRSSYVVSVSFRDSANHRWMRQPDGQLVRLT